MSEFKSFFELIRPNRIVGAVQCAVQSDRRWVVGLFHNHQLVKSVIADEEFTGENRQGGCPASTGFSFTVDPSRKTGSDLFEIRVLNTNHLIGRFSGAELGEEKGNNADGIAEPGIGRVRYQNGLTLSGEMHGAPAGESSYEVLAYLGADIFGRARINRWMHSGDPANVLGARAAFEILLDGKLADGDIHKIRVETSTGDVLTGSPVAVIAFPNQFREACRKLLPTVRSRFADMALDQLIENSVPFEAFADFHPDLGETSPTEEKAGSFGQFGLCYDTLHPDYDLILHKDVRLRPDLSEALHGLDGDICYFDLGLKQGEAVLPLLFPAFDQERFFEQGYASYAFAVRKDLLAGLSMDRLAGPFDLFLNLLQDGASTDIRHRPVPVGVLADHDPAETAAAMRHALAKWMTRNKRHAVQVAVTPSKILPALHLRREVSDRKVSVVIPTRDYGDLVWNCVTSLNRNNPGYAFDVTVVDNGSSERATLNILDRLETQGVRILEYREGFNYSVINNLAADHAEHEQLCFLNNDVVFDRPGSFDELCSRLSDPSVGAVGPLMSRASEVIQHGGVTLGPWRGACHAFEDRMLGDPGYVEWLLVARETSAVTGALLLTRKSLFEELGGFDEVRFPVNFNDVDYCLRLRELSKRVVFTPRAHVRHLESVSRGTDSNLPENQRMWREIDSLRVRWRDAVLDDPFFHPHFSVDTLPYRALKSERGHISLRTNRVRRSSDRPVGF